MHYALGELTLSVWTYEPVDVYTSDQLSKKVMEATKELAGRLEDELGILIEVSE